MHIPLKFSFQQQTLWLSSQRCIFWEEENTLIASDLHFGKTGHFRKSGIPVPQNVYTEDLQRLITQFQYFKPGRFVVVGDFFHSVANKEMDLFEKWRNDFSHISIDLVKGNHDILHASWYRMAKLNVTNQLHIPPFIFVHDIADITEAEKNAYYFSGHIHPAVIVGGLGKQVLKFPCYYFGSQFSILPAFGRFTGTVVIDPNKADTVFAILPANAKKGEKGVVIQL